MSTVAWRYLCQEEYGDESEEEKKSWINPEEVAEDDEDEDEEMDEM